MTLYGISLVSSGHLPGCAPSQLPTLQAVHCRGGQREKEKRPWNSLSFWTLEAPMAAHVHVFWAYAILCLHLADKWISGCFCSTCSTEKMWHSQMLGAYQGEVFTGQERSEQASAKIQVPLRCQQGIRSELHWFSFMGIYLWAWTWKSRLCMQFFWGE